MERSVLLRMRNKLSTVLAVKNKISRDLTGQSSFTFSRWLHLVDRYSKDKRNRTQEQAWQDMSIKFNREMNFVKEEDIKNLPLKDFLFTACSKLNIRILP